MHMAELPPFWPPSETDFPHTISRPPGSQSPLWSCAAGTSYKNLGLLGPRDCTGDLLESGASMRMAVPDPVANPCSFDSPPDVGDVPVQFASTRPRPPPTTSPGGGIGCFSWCSARPGGTHVHRINTQSIKSTLMWHAMHLCASTN